MSIGLHIGSSSVIPINPLAKWKVVAGPWDTINPTTGQDVIELTHAYRYNFTFDVEMPPYCRFTIPAQSQEAEYCWELTHDLILLDEVERPVFRGRIGTIREQWGADSGDLEVQATGYAGMLNRRIVFNGDSVSFTQVDQAEIAWSLINMTQNRVGGSLGISRGSGLNTGRKRDRTYEAGANLLDLITQLGQVIDGFDWEIDGYLRFNVFYPIRARTPPSTAQFTLDWGGMVNELSRSWTSQNYANVVRGQGGGRDVGGVQVFPTPVVKSASNIANAPEGRWETNLSWPDVSYQTTLDEHTDAELSRRNKRWAEITVGLRPGMWEGPEQLWIGDICQLVSPLRGRVAAAGMMTERTVRIMALSLDLGDDGTGDVVMTVTEDYTGALE